MNELLGSAYICNARKTVHTPLYNIYAHEARIWNKEHLSEPPARVYVLITTAAFFWSMLKVIPVSFGTLKLDARYTPDKD